MTAGLSYSNCRLCPRNCRVDRMAGQTGFCGATDEVIVSSAFPHRGEERELSGTNGSGTIFFCGCNLKCVFCQNHEISNDLRHGRAVTVEKLAQLMLSLQHSRCHNINFVTPTHYTPSIVQAVGRAREQGLAVPTVYNCGGYESAAVIEALEDYIDIYMPDFKFMDPDMSDTFLHTSAYPEKAKAALRIMDLQKGPLQLKGGLAVTGLIIRHLVMPGGYDDSRAIIDFISAELSPGTAVNIMGQYRPCFKAVNFKSINSYPDPAEIDQIKAYASDRGLTVLK